MNSFKTCFVIMPFRPELNYFYAYLQEYLYHQYQIVCERGDSLQTTDTLMEKLREKIALADLVIVDCTGNNPNVFYELGLAHALDKKVILITLQYNPQEIPTDLKAADFLSYADEPTFRAGLESAIQNLLTLYERWYQEALKMLKKFSQDTGINLTPVNLESFQELFDSDPLHESVKLGHSQKAKLAFVFEKIISLKDKNNPEIAEPIKAWMNTQ